MARVCLICSQTNRLTYERQYLQGTPISKIANDLGVSADCVNNHMSNHLSRQLSAAMAKKELDGSIDMLFEIDQIIRDTKTIFQRNFDKQADVTALKALDSQRSTLELLCKISAYMHQTKLLELQEQQQGESRESESEYQAKLSVLTLPELNMLSRISEKMESQDRKMIVIPESKLTWNSAIQRSKGTNYQPEEDNVVNDSKSTEEVDLEPIETPSPKKSRETAKSDTSTYESNEIYNARIQSEEYGQHSYINGRIVPNNFE